MKLELCDYLLNDMEQEEQCLIRMNSGYENGVPYIVLDAQSIDGFPMAFYINGERDIKKAAEFFLLFHARIEKRSIN